MRAYIAGPMTGVPEFNFPAFDEAAESFRSFGYEVVSPAEHDRDEGLDTHGLTGHEHPDDIGFDLVAGLLWDLEQVAYSDMIVLLPGWEKSSGAVAELALAAALGLVAVEYDDEMKRKYPAKQVLRGRLFKEEA